MEEFWKSTWKDAYVDVARSLRDSDIKGYFQAWERTEYARAVLYGDMGQLGDGDFLFYSPPTGYHEDRGMPVFPFLYAIRKPNKHCIFINCDLVFPFRSTLTSIMHKRDSDLTVYEVVHCFSSSGEFPRIFPVIQTTEEMNLDHVHFLCNAVYLAINGSPFETNAVEFLEAVLKEASNLEILILDHLGDEGKKEVKFYDDFCVLLSTCQAFLSNFQLHKIFRSSIHSNGFVVSQKNFNKLVTAFFATPTYHVQKFLITCTEIKCSDVSFECSPEIDQRYLDLRLSNLAVVNSSLTTRLHHKASLAGWDKALVNCHNLILSLIHASLRLKTGPLESGNILNRSRL